jgi:hypothetical protein
MKVVGHAATMVLLLYLVNAEALVVATELGRGAAEPSEPIAAIINKGMQIGFTIAAVMAAVNMVREALRLVKRLRVPRYSSF